MSAPQSEADAHGVRSSTTFEAQVAGTILTCDFMRDQGDLKTLSRLSFIVRLSWKGVEFTFAPDESRVWMDF
jgi:hypothetical protein